MNPLRPLLLSLLLLSGASLADQPLAVIELKSNLPEQVLPVIRPLLEPGDKISASQNTLFIRTTPERLQQIRQEIDRLDHPPRKLLITVRRGAGATLSQSGVSAGARIRLGDGRVIIGNPPRGRGAEIRLSQGSTIGSSNNQQRIQTLEGHPAFIHTGRSIAVPEQTTIVRGGTVITQRTTRFRDALQGFHVVPRVIGDRVTLEIHQQHDQPGMRRGTIELQHATATVSGRLGQWIDLGGIEGQVSREQRGLSGTGSQFSTRSLDLRVRVTELP